MNTNRLRRAAAFTLAAVLFAGMQAPAYASDISRITLELSGETPRPGREVGEIEAAEPGDALYWVDSSEYINESTNWSAGELPVVRIEVRADEDDRFTVSRESDIKFKGMGASLMRAEITFDDEMTVYAQLPVVSSDGVDYNLNYDGSLSWDDKTATWKAADGADKYEVQLALGDTVIHTVKTSQTSYSFLGMMGTPGNYYFRVRRLSGNYAGEWSDWSRAYSVRAPLTGQSSGAGLNSSAPANGAQGPVTLEGSISPASSVTPGWVQDNTGWWYRKADGGYVANDWLLDNGKWYLFDSRGYMLTGWQKHGGIDYYLGSDGAMYANGYTPDGWYVGSSGAWDASVPRR